MTICDRILIPIYQAYKKTRKTLNWLISIVRFWSVYRESWKIAGICPSYIHSSKSLYGYYFTIIEFERGNVCYWCFKQDDGGWVVQFRDNDLKENPERFLRRNVLISKHLKKTQNMTMRQAVQYCADAVLILDTYIDEKIYERDIENATIETSLLNIF